MTFRCFVATFPLCPVAQMTRRLDIDAAGICKVGSRLHNRRALPLIDAHFLDVVQTELAKVNHPVLCIPKFDAIVVDAHVLRPQGTQIHRLQTSDTSIILQLYAAHEAQGIGHSVGIHFLKVLALQCLWHNCLVVSDFAANGHVVNHAHRILGNGSNPLSNAAQKYEQDDTHQMSHSCCVN